MNTIKKLINIILKIFNLKLIKIVDQFDNSYRLILGLNEKKINYILDVGANNGQFVEQLRFYGYKEDIISFEPLLSAHEKLKKIQKKMIGGEFSNQLLLEIKIGKIVLIFQKTLYHQAS